MPDKKLPVILMAAAVLVVVSGLAFVQTTPEEEDFDEESVTNTGKLFPQYQALEDSRILHVFGDAGPEGAAIENVKISNDAALFFQNNEEAIPSTEKQEFWDDHHLELWPPRLSKDGVLLLFDKMHESEDLEIKQKLAKLYPNSNVTTCYGCVQWDSDENAEGDDIAFDAPQSVVPNHTKAGSSLNDNGDTLEVADTANASEHVDWAPAKTPEPDYGPYFSTGCIDKDSYAITNGTVLYACFDEYLIELGIFFDDVGSDSVLTIDIPYTRTFPLMTAENKDHFIALVDDEQIDSPSVVYQCQDYQTFEVVLPSGVNALYLFGAGGIGIPDAGGTHEHNLTIPLLELDDACVSETS